MRPEEAPAILIARPEVRAQMGLPDIVIPIQLGCLSQLVSSTPVKCLTVAQAAAEHEQLVGQLQALVALRDYLPLHIYHDASNHLFGVEEMKQSDPAHIPRLRPEYANLRAYAAGNIELCKSFFFELDRHLHEVLAPRLDELGMIRHGSAWPAPPHGYSIDLDEAPIRKRMTRSN
ncbi:g7062 [Coccomyxa elongata]